MLARLRAAKRPASPRDDWQRADIELWLTSAQAEQRKHPDVDGRQRLHDNQPQHHDASEDAEPVEPAKRTRKRKPSIASVIRQMQRAGVDVAGCEINPRDGTVTIRHRQACR